MKILWRFSLFIHVILLGSAVGSLAQAQATQSIDAAAQRTESVIIEPVLFPTPSPSPSPPPRPNFIKDILRDQKAIWLSPFRLRQKDLKWVVPFAAATTALILTDRETSSWVGRNGSLPGVSRNVSLGGSDYAAGGVAAGFYLVGRATGDHRAKETGKLAAEAFINTKIVVKVLKFATQRQRPNIDAGQGRFFTRGSSFPSGHAGSVFAVATVISYEYQHRPLIRYGAFAAAAAISMSRYSGRSHFLSDILVGGAIGFGVGRYVYRTRHRQPPGKADKAPPKTVTWLPTVVPFYDRRTSTFGGSVTWNL